MNTIVDEYLKIEDMIYEIRGHQVMLDSDLAKLYQCKNGTKTINLAVIRHINKFPENFMFQLTLKETNLINYNLENDKLILNFDNTIYTNNSNKILEEVIYTISLSVTDNYNIKEVIFEVNNKEIYKKNTKTIE